MTQHGAGRQVCVPRPIGGDLYVRDADDWQPVFGLLNGGLDLAVQSVFPQAQTAWHCEFDKAPSAILNHHYPDVPNLHDVTQVDWEKVEPVDVITAGYPCQPFSAAGNRKGANDERHLWPYVREAISEMSPSLVVLENVFGHLSLGFDEVLADLQLLNYETHWTITRASDIGAPHHRARLFMLATKGNNDGSVWSWIDRWRRVHRNPAKQGKRESQRIRGTIHCDGGQGPSRPTENVRQVRREHYTAQSGKGEELSRSLEMGGDRAEGVRCPHGSIPRPDRQAGCGEHCAATSENDRQCGETSEWERDLDTGDERLSGRLCRSDQGKESEGTGPQLPGFSGDCVLPCGGLVGAERRSLWPSSLSWEVPEDRANGVREGIRSSLSGVREFKGGGGNSTSSHPHVLGLQAGHERPGGPGEEVPVADGGGGTLSGDGGIYGRYEPVVRRWEQATGTTAPNPTELNRNGKPHLNVEFAEWMMGLPKGWVTGVPGLSRAQQLKAIGNGVVPQQAAEALKGMLA